MYSCGVIRWKMPTCAAQAWLSSKCRLKPKTRHEWDHSKQASTPASKLTHSENILWAIMIWWDFLDSSLPFSQGIQCRDRCQSWVPSFSSSEVRLRSPINSKNNSSMIIPLGSNHRYPSRYFLEHDFLILLEFWDENHPQKPRGLPVLLCPAQRALGSTAFTPPCGGMKSWGFKAKTMESESRFHRFRLWPFSWELVFWILGC